MQQMKFKWQPVTMAVDERVYPACVRLELAPLIRWKGCCGTVGRRAQLQITLHLVVQDEFGPEDLRELSGRMTAQRVHLPQAILRGDVALREEQIFHGGGVDGRNALRIARDGDWRMQAFDGERAVDGGQHGAHHVPRPDRSRSDEAGHDDEKDETREEKSAKKPSTSAGPRRVPARSINILAREQARLSVWLRPQCSEPVAMFPLQRRSTRIVRQAHPSAEFTFAGRRSFGAIPVSASKGVGRLGSVNTMTSVMQSITGSTKRLPSGPVRPPLISGEPAG